MSSLSGMSLMREAHNHPPFQELSDCYNVDHTLGRWIRQGLALDLGPRVRAARSIPHEGLLVPIKPVRGAFGLGLEPGLDY